MSWNTWAHQPARPIEIEQLYAIAYAGCRAFSDSSAGVFGHYSAETPSRHNCKRWPAEWRVSDNSDRGWGALILTVETGKWAYRNGWYSGEDFALESFNQALVCAVRMFQYQTPADRMSHILSRPLTAVELYDLAVKGAGDNGHERTFAMAFKLLLELMQTEQREQLLKHTEVTQLLEEAVTLPT